MKQKSSNPGGPKSKEHAVNECKLAEIKEHPRKGSFRCNSGSRNLGNGGTNSLQESDPSFTGLTYHL